MSTTITSRVTNTNDDASRDNFAGSWTFHLNDAVVKVGVQYWNGLKQYMGGSGMRFANITIPKSYIILSAKITFTASSSLNVDTVNSQLRGELSANAAVFSTDADFTGRTRTAAQVAWDVIGHWLITGTYDSIDISPIIQEIVNQGTWVSGNALVIFWDDFDDRSTHAANCCRTAECANTDPLVAPLLTVTYKAPATGGGGGILTGVGGLLIARRVIR